MSRGTRHPLVMLAEADRRLRRHHAVIVLGRLVEALGESERPVYVGAWARLLVVDPRTMQRALSLLDDAGYIERTREARKGGLGIVYCYRLGTCARVEALSARLAS